MQGFSTTRAQQLTEKLCGEEFSSRHVPRIAAVLDAEVGKFKQRTLVAYTYLYLDAQYEKIRNEGGVRFLAILKAPGATPDGLREVLGISCGLLESKVHWRSFLERLIKKGCKIKEMLLPTIDKFCYNLLVKRK